MGKKRAFKKLKQLSDTMPPVMRETRVGNKIVEVPLNHYRNLKNLYVKYGVDYVNQYTKELQQFVESQKPQ